MSFLLYLVVFLEGFSTLAVQVIAIRKAIPVVGSSVIMTSIIIGIILLALSSGYYVGGMISSKSTKKSLLKKLSWFLLITAVYYAGLTFPFEGYTLNALLSMNYGYIESLFYVGFGFFFIPIFLASMTVPFLTELIEGGKGESAGKILFISTIGSFIGSVGTTIFLFQYVGVEGTGYIVSGMLILCAMILQYIRSKTPGMEILLTIMVILGLTFIKEEISPAQIYAYESPYQTIKIFSYKFQGQPIRLMEMNGGSSSAIYTHDYKSFFPYVREIVDITHQAQPKKILLIGTAGFTYPQEISAENYVERIDAVDIDSSIKTISEKYFLQQPLNSKIFFAPQSARFFVQQTLLKKEKYDMIVVDAYNGTTIPDELITKEFFLSLKDLSDHIVFNFILDRKLTSDFSQKLFFTLNEVYGESFIKIATIQAIQQSDNHLDNFIVSTKTFSDAVKVTSTANSVYTDDLATSESDKVAMMFEK